MSISLERFSDSVSVEHETLSDGSKVYNVRMRASEVSGAGPEPSMIRFGCMSKAHALTLAAQLEHTAWVETEES